MSEHFHLSGKLLTRNWGLNLLGQILAAVAALPAIPFIVGRLGTERFGVLSMAWVLLGYFGLFDLGLGRATTKYAAECLGRGEMHTLSTWVWTSLWSQLVFGVAGTMVAACLVPSLVHLVLKISPDLQAQAQTCFLLLAASLPLVLVTNSLRGVLEAAQRFDVVNYVRVPSNVSLFVLPVVGVLFKVGLTGCVVLLILARLLAGIAYLLFCFTLYPVLRHELSIDFRKLRSLLGYGGWVTISSILGPLLAYLDRFVIGSMVSMSAVGYYSVPSEAMTRISVIPGSLSSTTFPAFSSLEAASATGKIEELCVRSVKALVLILGILVVLVMIFARTILQVWLGSEFAAKGTVVLQILAAGALANSLAMIPYGMLQAMGRPDLPAKFHLFEFPIYLALLWVLTERLGVTGAAIAWTFRSSLDAALLFGAAVRLRWVSLGKLCSFVLLSTIGMVCAFGALLAVVVQTLNSVMLEFALTGVLILSFGLAAWKYLLDGRDRTLLRSVLARGYLPLARAE